jgi:hypothetical protein
MMAYQDNQQFPFQGAQHAGWMNPQQSQTYGLGQPAYGQQFGFGGNQFGQSNLGGWGLGGGGLGGWPQQRQLSQYEVGDVVRQLVPLLPQIIAQAQLQPQAAFGYGGMGGFGGYGQQPQRLLTQQDVQEVVRQILPILPQIVSMLQGQNPLHTAAIYGGNYGGANSQVGWQNPFGQFANPLQQLQQNPFQQNPFQQQWGGQQGWPQTMAAYGGMSQSNQRQLSQHDVNEVVRQLAGIIPQVISGLQAYGQQRVN